MTTARTIAGVVTRIGQPSSTRPGAARAFDDVEASLGDGIDIDLDHNGHRIGETIYIERGQDDRIQAVAVLDDADWIDELDQPLYFSGRWEMIGGAPGDTFIARTARLLSIALTATPATVAATPIRSRAGDVRRPFDRSRWPLSWGHQDGLLQRAAHDTDDRPDARAGWITDRRTPEPQHAVNPWDGSPLQLRARAPGEPWIHDGGYVIAVR